MLAGEEERLAHRADATLLVSEAEAALFTSRLRDPNDTDVRALRNGIDTVSYDPQAIAPHPALVGEAGPHIVFTGQMDYAPNVSAVLRTAEQLLPAIRRCHAQATFHVVAKDHKAPATPAGVPVLSTSPGSRRETASTSRSGWTTMRWWSGRWRCSPMGQPHWRWARLRGATSSSNRVGTRCSRRWPG